jgi:hypothetical protein
MGTHLWCRIPHSAVGKELAAEWTQKQRLLAADVSIRGKVKSYDALATVFDSHHHAIKSVSANKLVITRRRPRDWAVRSLVQRSEAFFRAQLAEQVPAVFGPKARQRYFLNALKLLWSAPGEGLQPLHFDVAQRNLASTRYSCLLYCTPCYHTAVPDAPARDLAAAFNTTATLSDTQLAKNQEVFRPVTMLSDLVPAGSGMLFNAAVAHHGVANQMRSEDRISLSSALASTKTQTTSSDFPLV